MTIQPVAQLLQNLATSSDPDLHFIALSDLLQSVKSQQIAIQLLDGKQTRQVLQLLTSHQADIVQMTIKLIPLMDIETVVAVLCEMNFSDFHEIIVMSYHTLIGNMKYYDRSLLTRFISMGNTDLITHFCKQFKKDLKKTFDPTLFIYLDTLGYDQKCQLLRIIVECVPKQDIDKIIDNTLNLQREGIQSRYFYGVIQAILDRDASFAIKFKSILQLPKEINEENLIDACSCIDLFYSFIDSLSSLYTALECDQFFKELIELMEFSLDEEMEEDDFGFESDLDIDSDLSWRIRYHSFQLASKFVISNPDIYNPSQVHTAFLKRMMDSEAQVVQAVVQFYITFLDKLPLTASQHKKRKLNDNYLDIKLLLINISHLLGKNANNDESLFVLTNKCLEHSNLPQSIEQSFPFLILDLPIRHPNLQLLLIATLLKYCSSLDFVQRILGLFLKFDFSIQDILPVLNTIRKYELVNAHGYEYLDIQPIPMELQPIFVKVLEKYKSQQVSYLNCVATFYCDIVTVDTTTCTPSMLIEIYGHASRSSLFISKCQSRDFEQLLASCTALELPLLLTSIGRVAASITLSNKPELFKLINQQLPDLNELGAYFHLLPYLGDSSVNNYLEHLVTTNSEYIKALLPLIDYDLLLQKAQQINTPNFSELPQKYDLLVFYGTLLSSFPTQPTTGWLQLIILSKSQQLNQESVVYFLNSNAINHHTISLFNQINDVCIAFLLSHIPVDLQIELLCLIQRDITQFCLNLITTCPESLYPKMGHLLAKNNYKDLSALPSK